MEWVKIDKHEFNIEAVKSMSLSEFKKLYSNVLSDKVEVIYYKISGKKKSSKKRKES